MDQDNPTLGGAISFQFKKRKFQVRGAFAFDFFGL